LRYLLIGIQDEVEGPRDHEIRRNLMSETIFAALAGGAVGAACTGLVSYVLETGRRCIRVKSLCLGLATELETVWAQHMRNCGNDLMQVPVGSHFTGYYLIRGDYFVNYHANASDLGELRNTKLRERIVAIYSELKGFVDSFHAHNELITGKIGVTDVTVLAKYTAILQSANNRLATAIPKLVDDLRNESEFL
jgi:hypothetical protein